MSFDIHATIHTCQAICRIFFHTYFGLYGSVLRPAFCDIAIFVLLVLTFLTFSPVDIKPTHAYLLGFCVCQFSLNWSLYGKCLGGVWLVLQCITSASMSIVPWMGHCTGPLYWATALGHCTGPLLLM